MEPPIILNSNKSESLCCVLYINDLKIEQNVVIISSFTAKNRVFDKSVSKSVSSVFEYYHLTVTLSE